MPDKGVDEVEGAATGREFQFETPTRFSGHQCPQHDQWGVYGYNDQYYEALGGACTPRDIWNQSKYQFSDPDAWLYDVNNINGWGHHPDEWDLLMWRSSTEYREMVQERLALHMQAMKDGTKSPYFDN